MTREVSLEAAVAAGVRKALKSEIMERTIADFVDIEATADRITATVLEGLVDAYLAAIVADVEDDALCAECARGYHVNHVSEWQLREKPHHPYLHGAGACSKCSCEWRA